MSTELDKALAYWKSKHRHPKAQVYAQAIEAKIKGEPTDSLVVDHELANAIAFGTYSARDEGETAQETPTPEPKPRKGRKTGSKGQETGEGTEKAPQSPDHPPKV
ncbi:hypothetical protein [Oryzicola mucosus]|uniref:Uncharacterized protein n=1 Tax=Oryzicola mucosus TaxID=2767425 RepID=A0A8J6U125_9HYPH|nr:hypothetical protein [Oryzicola mucosus]MBD0416516.1 hypothetical protein [Oryzicola mucosus]